MCSSTFTKFTLKVGFTFSLAGSSRLAQAIYTYKEARDVSVKRRSEIVKPVLQQNGHFTEPVVLQCRMLESTIIVGNSQLVRYYELENCDISLTSFGELIMRRSIPSVTYPCHSQSVELAVKIGSVYLLKLVI